MSDLDVTSIVLLASFFVIFAIFLFFDVFVALYGRGGDRWMGRERPRQTASGRGWYRKKVAIRRCPGLCILAVYGVGRYVVLSGFDHEGFVNDGWFSLAFDVVVDPFGGRLGGVVGTAKHGSRGTQHFLDHLPD